MEYVYAALLIHKAGGNVDGATVTKVLEAAGVTVDAAKVKALIASLEGVDITEAISKAAVTAAPAAASTASESAAPAAVEKKEDKKEDDGAAAAGLGALFG